MKGEFDFAKKILMSELDFSAPACSQVNEVSVLCSFIVLQIYFYSLWLWHQYKVERY